MTGYETAATTLGGINAGINAGSWIGDLAYGAKDREYAKWLNDEQLKRYDEMMEYQKQQDATAQANFESQMAFQQQQFEANRIGNITKEYAEAGLNPYLAAGMGASTASVVGGGASAGHATGTPNTKPISHYQIQSKNDILGGLSQLMMQEQLNEAEVKKIEADARLSNAQADDLESTRADRIAKLRAETNLTNEQIEEIIARTNNIMTNTKVQEATEILTNKKSTTQELENAKREIENEILANVKETEKEKAKAELKKIKTETRIMNYKEAREWVDFTLSKLSIAGFLARTFF